MNASLLRMLQRHGLRFRARPINLAAAALAALVLIVAGAYLLNVHLFQPPSPPSDHATGLDVGSEEAFVYLAGQHSNYCSLSTATVMTYADSARLQGSCCSSMNADKYRWQVEGLRRYAAQLPEMPEDPYDISVAKAKALIAYDTSLSLTPDEQGTYDAAMAMTNDKGPCCCQCWRWYMTAGLAKLMIVQRSMSATDVAAVVDLTNGCGGPLETAEHAGVT